MIVESSPGGLEIRFCTKSFATNQISFFVSHHPFIDAPSEQGCPFLSAIEKTPEKPPNL